MEEPCGSTSGDPVLNMFVWDEGLVATCSSSNTWRISVSALLCPAGGVISYVGSCGGSPSRTSPVSVYSENSDSQPGFSSCSSSSGFTGDDGSSSASSSSGGSPRGRDDGGSRRASPSKAVASLSSKSPPPLVR